MAEISMAMISELRERSGVGIGKCKEALSEAKGDMDLAISNLRKAGMASAVKKEGRSTNEGMIGTSEKDDTIAIVEVNAETDFVVKNERFQQFLSHIADEIAETKPTSLENFLSQKFSKDSALTVDEYRASVVQAIGENIQIRRMKTYQKGSTSTIGVYSHLGGKIVTVVEIEGSDSVADLARDVAMHIAAEAPEYLDADDVPQSIIDHEKEIAREQLKGKPENIMDKILEGKINAYFNDVCLARQKYIKNDSLSVGDLVYKSGQESGNPLKITQFLRWTVGESA